MARGERLGACAGEVPLKVRYVIIAVISAVCLLSVIAAIGLTYYPRILGGGAGHGKANDSASAYDTRTLERLYSQMQAEVVFDSVASWAMECMGAPNYQKLPLQYQVWLSYLAPDGDDPPFPEGVHKLTNKQRSVVVLNRSLSFDREYYGLQQQEWYVFYEILQLSLIFVGMLTTITVSISSSEFGRGEGLRPRLFRFSAIILPILGTALAGVVAFYSPQARWNQAGTTLASLAQLQSQMAIDVWKLRCTDDDPKDNDGDRKLISEWSRRYADILSVSAAAGAPPKSAPMVKQ